MPERKTVGQLMEEMRLKAGAQNYHGHEYMDLERFAEDTRHMICTGQVQTVHPSATAVQRGTQTKSKRERQAKRYQQPDGMM